MFLSRLADNDFGAEGAGRLKIGAEGAGRLAEPLGKLTALQHLDLRGTGSAFCFLFFVSFHLK